MSCVVLLFCRLVGLLFRCSLFVVGTTLFVVCGSLVIAVVCALCVSAVVCNLLFVVVCLLWLLFVACRLLFAIRRVCFAV